MVFHETSFGFVYARTSRSDLPSAIFEGMRSEIDAVS
jgi:hypothetical protein